MTPHLTGILAMLCAAMIWGVSPLFFSALSAVPAHEVLAHRMVWSLIFFGAMLLLQGRMGEVFAALKAPRARVLVVGASVLIAVNWWLFIWTVQSGNTTQSALGYYIYPLVAVLLGRVVFGEQLTRWQGIAVLLAALAVVFLTIGLGTIPVLALALAVSFGLYGMLKKQLSVGPVVSVTAEVVLLTPVAILLMLQTYHSGGAVFGPDWLTALLLVLSGPLTAVPLILFSFAARRLAMSTLGLMLYVNPTVQFFLAVTVLGEPLHVVHLVAFSLIWSALAIYSAAGWRVEKDTRKASRAASASGTIV